MMLCSDQNYLDRPKMCVWITKPVTSSTSIFRAIAKLYGSK